MAPQGRVKLRKVKTGCYTCKARRVKCDEEKPFCRRCINAGRKCEGYYSTASLNSERRADPPTALSLLPNCSDRERRYFHLYHARTIDSICAYFGSYFWSTLVPQVSIREPSVQHALLALTAVHESVATAGRPDVVGLRLDPSNVFAVVHYNKAIAHLTTPEQRHSTDTVLLCCVIFVCIELVRNNTRAALDHIHAGLRLLQDARSRESPSQSQICISTHPSNIRESLDTTFARLDIQSMFLGATPQLTLSHPNSTHPNSTPLSTPTGIPSNFASLPEARAYFETLSGTAFHFMRTNPEPQYGVALTPEAAGEHEAILARMRAWGESFEPLFERSKTCSTSIRRTAQILKLQQASAYVWIASHTRKSEAEYERFTPQFAEVVRLSRSIVLDKDVTFPSRGSALKKVESFRQPEFAFDFGAMAALHFTSMKCRVPQIRHEALRLLILSPRQEGVFNREFVGKISAYAIEVEEAAAAKRHAAPLPSITSDTDALKSALVQVHEEEEKKQYTDLDQLGRRPSSESSISQSLKTLDPSPEAFEVQPLSDVYGEPQDVIEVRTRQQELLQHRAWNQAMHENQASADIVAAAVAQRASGGRIVEINERIMGYDVDSESYSFDVRNF